MGVCHLVFALILIGTISLGNFQDCKNAVSDPKYTTCPINLTIAIDFSSFMRKYENIQYKINIVFTS
uniref:Uncharacterized protein n=1 Tax=Acrobeloides nanus TaxID=290746 RepID=A0A914EK81_9BILA